MTYVQNRSPTGGVPSVVRNLGWTLATGDFAHCPDDDNIVTEGIYHRVKGIFLGRPGAGLVSGWVEPFGDVQIKQLERERRHSAQAARRSLVCQRFDTRCGFVASMLLGDALLGRRASVPGRQCLDQLNGFDQEIRLMEDADFHAHAMKEFGVYFMNGVLTRSRIAANSLVHPPAPSERQFQQERAGHYATQRKHGKRRGAHEFYAFASLDRSFLRLMSRGRNRARDSFESWPCAPPQKISLL